MAKIGSLILIINTFLWQPQIAAAHVPGIHVDVFLDADNSIATNAGISLPTTTVIQGTTATLPLHIETGSTPLAAFAFEIRYDPAVVRVESCQPNVTMPFEDIRCRADYDADDIFPDSIRINGIAPNGFSGVLDLATIEFTAIGAPGQTSSLTLHSALYADTSATTFEPTTSAGRVDIVAPSSLRVVNSSTVGGPGSTFTIEGVDFTPSQIFTLRINDTRCCTVNSDGSGRFRLSLETPSHTSEGHYRITVVEIDSAFTGFSIRLGQPIRQADPNSGPRIVIDVPQPQTLLYVPVMVAP